MAPITWKNVAAPRLDSSFIGDAANLFNKGLNQGQELIQGKIDEGQNTALQNLRQQAYQDPNLTQEGLNSLIGSAGLDADRQQQALDFGSTLIRQNEADARQDIENQQTDTLFGLKQTQAEQDIQSQENIFTDRAIKQKQETVSNELTNNFLAMRGKGIPERDILNNIQQQIDSDPTLTGSQKLALLSNFQSKLEDFSKLTGEEQREVTTKLSTAQDTYNKALQPLEQNLQTNQKLVDSSPIKLGLAAIEAGEDPISIARTMADPTRLSIDWFGDTRSEAVETVRDYLTPQKAVGVYSSVISSLTEARRKQIGEFNARKAKLEADSGKPLTKKQEADLRKNTITVEDSDITHFKNLKNKRKPIDPAVLATVVKQSNQLTSLGGDTRLETANMGNDLKNVLIRLRGYEKTSDIAKNNIKAIDKQKTLLLADYNSQVDKIKQAPYNTRRLVK